MTNKEEFLYEFYSIVEKIDEKEFIRKDFLYHMQEMCKLFQKYGICKIQEGKEDE
jgi:hypothetical protein